jgi:hypothetical protein
MANEAVLQPAEIFIEEAALPECRSARGRISAARGILFGLALSAILWVGIYYTIAVLLAA